MRGPKTFVIDVKGVGAFECRRRTMRTAIEIEVEYARLTQGVAGLDVETQYISRLIAYLKAMVLAAPDGWDVETMDPDEGEDFRQIQEVFTAIKAEEQRFRGPGHADAPAAREGAE